MLSVWCLVSRTRIFTVIIRYLAMFIYFVEPKYFLLDEQYSLTVAAQQCGSLFVVAAIYSCFVAAIPTRNCRPDR